MTHALTPAQVDVLRRVRDGRLWSDEPPAGELAEALFLASFCLLHYVERGIFTLTDQGAVYLAAVERDSGVS